MYDHEINDVMARSKHPALQVEFALARPTRRGMPHPYLQVLYRNVGRIYAEYVNGFLRVPSGLLVQEQRKEDRHLQIDETEYVEINFANIHRDLVQVRPGIPDIGSFRGTPPQPYYVTRYDPVLPGLARSEFFELNLKEEDLPAQAAATIMWVIYADNAPRREGTIVFGAIPYPA
jgi:hypothetical protein